MSEEKTILYLTGVLWPVTQKQKVPDEKATTNGWFISDQFLCQVKKKKGGQIFWIAIRFIKHLKNPWINCSLLQFNYNKRNLKLSDYYNYGTTGPISDKPEISKWIDTFNSNYQWINIRFENTIKS